MTNPTDRRPSHGAAYGARLGRALPRGPTATGERYCMNSASLCLDGPKS
jgi:peptide methionine sulfoxide reductase MsrB